MNGTSCAIIGGGPAGLFAAWCAARFLRGGTITVFERNSQCARKLLVTGSGQCNLTRDASCEHMLAHYGEHGRFLVHAMHALDPHHTMRIFEYLGLPLAIREDDKVFPASFKASDVARVLVDACLAEGVRFIHGSRMTSVTKEGSRFLLNDEGGNTYAADAVLLATGGMTYPKTGSTGDGYALANQLGHTVTPVKPALCSVSVQERQITDCSGLSVDPALLIHTGSDTVRRVASGAVLITHDGLSGPVILNHSRYLSSGDTIRICWLPRSDGSAASAQEIERHLIEACARHGAAQLATVVHELGLPMKLVNYLLKEAAVDGTKKAAETGKKSLSPLSSLLAGQPFTVSLNGKLNQAMVSAGGVALKEVDPRTMASRKVEGLYFAGELLDIDGDTGGYNLQAAWSSAALAGISMVGAHPFTAIGQLCTLGLRN